LRTIVHISDPHFGKVNYALVEPFIAAVQAQQPDLVICSGDLTQHASMKEFNEARAFLKRLPQPQLVIPGNHDVPVVNLGARLFTPLRKYKRYICSDPDPFFQDDEIAVAGINTARGFTIDSGRISMRTVERITERMDGLPENITRIVVLHHPIDLPLDINERRLVKRAREAMHKFSDCGADVFLTGHRHEVYTGNTSERYTIDGYAALVVQAGTCISTRIKGEPNSFNVMRIEEDHIIVERHWWKAATLEFSLAVSEEFIRTEEGWRKKEVPFAVAA
jgi:3',5'-cyclic AMP phosphodiesterase CpdA